MRVKILLDDDKCYWSECEGQGEGRDVAVSCVECERVRLEPI